VDLSDRLLLRAFQEQVAYSCRAVLLGFEDVQLGLEELGSEAESGRLWYGVQNLVIGAGNVSKALWGTGPTQELRDRRYAERQPLRDSLGVTDTSPLRRIKIRNDFEHLDERIEDWWNESKSRSRIGILIGPRGSVGGAGWDDMNTLRWLDPESGDVIFWGNELHIPSVVNEVNWLWPVAEAEGNKPHWQPRTSGGGL
jgi:hypothetical protein